MTDAEAQYAAMTTAQLRKSLRLNAKMRGTLSPDDVDQAHNNLMYAELLRRKRAHAVSKVPRRVR